MYLQFRYTYLAHEFIMESKVLRKGFYPILLVGIIFNEKKTSLRVLCEDFGY